VLRLQRGSLSSGDRVVLVDDWVETGSQFRAAGGLIAECGAELVGCSVIVDDMTDQVRAGIGRSHAIVRSAELA
jgi:adenine phosphoribosyltransferase